MIVDTDDNPLRRAGGIYFFKLNPALDEDAFTLLDYLDWEDLQIQGFLGFAYIGSADFHKVPSHEDHYRIFITDGISGTIFIFNFNLTPDKQELVYVNQKYFPLQSLFTKE